MKPVNVWNRIYGDFLMRPRLGAYESLLREALEAGYEIVSVERFWQTIQERSGDPGRRFLIMRHDIDTDPATAAALWEIDQRLGVEASYYFRISTVDLDLMRAIGAGGSHASYHYEDLATIVKRRHLRTRDGVLAAIPEAKRLFARHLTALRERTGLPMRVVASHGDFVNRRVRVPNWAILADRALRREVGIDLETYDAAFMRHVTSRHADAGYPAYWTPEDPMAAIERGESVVYVLTHPRHWRANPAVNLRDDLTRIDEGFRHRLGAEDSDVPARAARRTRPVGTSASTSPNGSSLSLAPADPTTPVRPPSRRRKATEEPAASRRPMLVVTTPAGRQEERRYAIDVVLSEWLGLDHQLEIGAGAGVTIGLVGDPDGLRLSLPDGLFSTPDGAWLTEASMPFVPLPRVTLPGDDGAVGPMDSGDARAPLPVLFGTGAPDGRAWQRSPQGLDLTVDVFGSVFFLLTGYEEVVRRVRDEHERAPAYASLAAVEGFIERPLVDEYADVLWAALHATWPVLERRPSAFRLRLTHDVDQPWAALGQPTRLVAQSFAADVLDRRDVDLASRRAWSFAASRVGRMSNDPFDTFDLLMTTSEEVGLRSAFYFLASNAFSGSDGRYTLSDPPIGRLLREIHERGHEIGLHASYESFRSPEATRLEFETLRSACRAVGVDQEAWGVRQHFLRFEIPQTWRNHAAAGLDYDASLGFADYVGFRAGTGREFPVFDLEAGRRLPLRERPLVVMDASLLGYMGLGLEAAVGRAGEVVDACRRHGSDATICYHNSSLPGARQRRHYRALVDDLAVGSATWDAAIPASTAPGGRQS